MPKTNSKKRKYEEFELFWKEKRYIVKSQSKNLVVVYVDGACKGNNHKEHEKRRAGFGMYCSATGWKFGKSIEPPRTNNRAELLAMINLMRIYAESDETTLDKQFGTTSQDDSELCIVGDNEYVLKFMTEWIDDWKANDFCKVGSQPVLNQDLIIELADMVDLFKKKKWCISVSWVRAHQPKPNPDTFSNVYCKHWEGNFFADQTATTAAIEQKDVTQ